MRALFYSWVCEHCEGLPEGDYDRGYVVWRDRPPASEEYVFRTKEDAERWRAHKQYGEKPIRIVLSEQPFRWRMSNGTITDVELADHLFEIYPDHRFEPGPYRAFLAPEQQAS